VVLIFSVGCSSPEEKLKNNGYEINAKDFSNLYENYIENESNDLKSIELFFRAGFTSDSIDGKLEYENKFECYPVSFNKQELVKLMFKYELLNVEFEQTSSGDNLLHTAIFGTYEEVYDVSDKGIIISNTYPDEYQLNFDMIKFLLKKGVDVNKKNEQGLTPLLMAVQYGNANVVSELINHGSDIEAVSATKANEWTPLIIATAQNDFEIVKLLVDNGASIIKSVILNHQTNDMFNAYSQAEYNDYKEILDYFDVTMNQKIENAQSDYPLAYKISEIWTGGEYTVFDQCKALETMIRALNETDEVELLSYGKVCFTYGDKDDAFTWYNKMINEGSYNACFRIIDSYYSEPDNNYTDTDQVISLANKAIELGDKSGQAENILGILYFKGNGVEQSYETAREYFVKAEKKENSNATGNIAACDYYLNGNSKQKNTNDTYTNSKQTNCENFASIDFDASHTCIINSSLSIQRSGSDISISDGVYHSATVSDYSCIKGTYNFSWTFYSQCLNMGDPDGPYTYSGTFYLDGEHSSYSIYVSDGYAEVSGY